MGKILHFTATTTETKVLSNTKQSRELENTSQALRHQSEDSRKVEEAHLSSQSGNKAEEPAFMSVIA